MNETKIRWIIKEYSKNQSSEKENLIFYKYLYSQYSRISSVFFTFLLALIPVSTTLFAIESDIPDVFILVLQVFMILAGIVLGALFMVYKNKERKAHLKLLILTENNDLTYSNKSERSLNEGDGLDIKCYNVQVREYQNSDMGSRLPNGGN